MKVFNSRTFLECEYCSQRPPPLPMVGGPWQICERGVDIWRRGKPPCTSAGVITALNSVSVKSTQPPVKPAEPLNASIKICIFSERKRGGTISFEERETQTKYGEQFHTISKLINQPRKSSDETSETIQDA